MEPLLSNVNVRRNLLKDFENVSNIESYDEHLTIHLENGNEKINTMYGYHERNSDGDPITDGYDVDINDTPLCMNYMVLLNINASHEFSLRWSHDCIRRNPENKIKWIPFTNQQIKWIPFRVNDFNDIISHKPDGHINKKKEKERRRRVYNHNVIESDKRKNILIKNRIKGKYPNKKSINKKHCRNYKY